MTNDQMNHLDSQFKILAEMKRSENVDKSTGNTKCLFAKRRGFLINLTLTIIVISILVCAFIINEVRSDSSQTIRKVFSTELQPDSIELVQPPAQPNELQLVPSSQPTQATSGAMDTNLSNLRQPRATTRRKNLATSSTSTTLTSASGSGNTVTTTPAAQGDSEPSTSTSKPLSSTRAAIKSKQAQDEDEVTEEAEAAAEAEEAERISAIRRKIKNRKKINQQAIKPEHTSASSTTLSASTPLASSISTGRQIAKGSRSSTEISIGSTTTLAASKHIGHHHKHLNGTKVPVETGDPIESTELTDEEDPEYEYELKSSTSRPMSIDLSKAKSSKVERSNETQTDRAHHKKYQNDSTPLSEKEGGTLEMVANTNDGEQSTGPLDARSPGALGKRITEFIADSKSKLRNTTALVSTTGKHFNHTKAYKTTEVPPITTTISTDDSSSIHSESVHLVNQTLQTPSLNLTDYSKHLDWSKLVKVVFKSLHDNQTLYTIVMNSSELSNHPVNDWSNELPSLLRRDLEKLIQKWLNVFPVDHLLSDLTTIITAKHPVNSSSTSSPLLSSEHLSTSTNNPIGTTVATSVQKNSTVLITLDQTNTKELSNPVNNSMSNNSTTYNRQPFSTNQTFFGNQTINENQNIVLAPQNVTTATTFSTQTVELENQPSVSNNTNKSMVDMIQDIRVENIRIEDNVKEQSSSLKHFIIVCSISVVIATSLVVALIVLLIK